MEHQSFAKRTHGHQRVRKIRTRARYGQRRLKQISRTATLGGLFLSFLKIGLTGFGGGFAVLSQIRHVVVLERRWLGEHDFVEALALGQSLPGTSAGNAVTYIGYRLRGWRGAGASLSAFILPSMFMMIALAIFYDRFRALPNTEQLFHGFNSAVVALIAVTAWRMGKQTVSQPWQRILMILACAAVVVFKATVVEVILLSGLVGIGIEAFREKQLTRLERIRGFASRRQQRIRSRLVRRRAKPHRFFGGYLTEAIAEERLRRMSEAVVAQPGELDDYDHDALDDAGSAEPESEDVGLDRPKGSSSHAFIFLAIPGLAKLGLALSLAFIFLRIGAVTFGGGFVMIPEIEAEVVNSHHWLTHQEFADATALGQITPGPVLIMATFVGYRVAGTLGALFATICVFLPSFLMTIAAGSSFRRFRTNRQMQAFLRGVAPAVAGLLVAAAWSVGRSGIHSMIGLSMAVIILLILLRYRANAFWVLIGAGVFRYLMALVLR
ncbi:MAG TPA: chromate transporter [Pyrinomonadaceae bacterium]|nr:chromate transporter [Pyrinomonadaceae bacterium]